MTLWIPATRGLAGVWSPAGSAVTPQLPEHSLGRLAKSWRRIFDGFSACPALAGFPDSHRLSAGSPDFGEERGFGHFVAADQADAGDGADILDIQIGKAGDGEGAEGKRA